MVAAAREVENEAGFEENVAEIAEGVAKMESCRLR
jgi:exonuclease VII small subunit